MEYEDTNILRTQYVDDLVAQRQNLENILRKQGVEVQPGEGFESMIPKTELIEGAPVLPYYCFKSGKSSYLNTIIPNINFAGQKSLSGCFANVGTSVNEPLDLTSLNTINAEDISGMLAATHNFILGKNFLLLNVQNMDKLFSGHPYNTNTSGGVYNGSLRNCNQMSYQELDQKVTMQYFIAAVGVRSYMDKDQIKFLKDFFSKLYFKNEVNCNNFFYNQEYYNVDLEDLIHEFIASFRLIGSHLPNITSMYEMFSNATLDFIFTVAPCFNYENVVNMEYWARSTKSNCILESIHNRFLDLSDKIFYKIKNVNGLMYYTLQYGNSYFDINLGTAPNETLIDCSNAFASSGVRNLDMSGWNLGAVEKVSSMFYNANRLVELRFGYNLGKGYSKYNSNNGYATLSFKNCSALTYESILDVFNKLYDLKTNNLKTQKIELHATTKAKLTPEEIAIATNKGWTVS